MNDILRVLYDGEYDITPRLDETQRETGKKLCAEWDKVRTMFGDEFIDRLASLEGEWVDWQLFHCYREGFHLGFRLMLEALGG